MINKHTTESYCSEDISLIENYDKAIADTTQTWFCHHRRETIFTLKELMEIGEYYNRPAAELIFLTPSEHSSLHNKGNMHFLGHTHSEDTKRKMSELRQGKQWGWTKKHSHTEEAKKNISEALKGKNTWTKGQHFYNNGIKNVMAKECPEGFVPGRLTKKLLGENKLKPSSSV